MATGVEEMEEGKRNNLYVTVDGVTHEMNCEDIGLSPTASDEEIKQRLYEHFDAQFNFNEHMVTREPSGVILVKTSPVYG